MKQIILTLVIVATSLINTAFSQANYAGSIVIDPYYGAPNFGKSFASNFESTSNSNFKAKGLGPMGLRAEYMLADRFGIGFDFIYNNYDLTYDQIDSTYNGTTDTWTAVKTQNEYKMQRIRAHLRFNYHFEVSNPMLDSYFGIGAGTNNRFRKSYENGILVDNSDGDFDGFTLLPFSLRVCAGIRYYFAQNIGMNAEIGLGGPLVSAGLSLRF